MKIAFVYDAIYPYVKGGVEKRVWELAVRLSCRGHEVHVLGMKFWQGEDIIIQQGVILHGVCPARQLYKGGRRTVWQALYFGIHLITPLSREKFDIIDCQQFPYFSCFSAKLLSLIKKTPLVITWHEIWGDYWYEYFGWKGLFGKTIERLVARLTSNNLAVSRTTGKNLESLGLRGRITIIPNGVDIRKIRAVSPSKEPSDIIFVGRLIREKHVDLLIKAFKILVSAHPGLSMIIIGEGPERNTVSALIHALHLENQVHSLGFQDCHDDIFTYMKSSRICALPSTREGFGIAALEALACGLPVVTVDHPSNAIRDLITGRNGFLCQLSADELATTIGLGLEHHTEMRDACMVSAEPFDWDQIARDIEFYYQGVNGLKT